VRNTNYVNYRHSEGALET